MIEIWMKNHLVSDSILQHCKFLIPQNIYKDWKILCGLAFGVGDTTPWLTISIEQDN